VTDATKHKVLIIEGNEKHRNQLATRLETSGFKVEMASDGLDGLNAVRRGHPDLVILDIMLPGLDGHKICRMIKFDRKFGHIPVVVLTSRDLDDVAELAKQVKADAFCLKSTKTPVLIDIIRKLIERRQIQKTSEE
jgi:twitching motility two-component system response regulator PilH